MGIKRIETHFDDQTLPEIERSLKRLWNAVDQMIPGDVDGFSIVIETRAGQVICTRKGMTPEDLVSSAEFLRETIDNGRSITW